MAQLHTIATKTATSSNRPTKHIAASVAETQPNVTKMSQHLAARCPAQSPNLQSCHAHLQDVARDLPKKKARHVDDPPGPPHQ